MRRFFVIAASAAAFCALPASANASTPFGMPSAQTHRIKPVLEVCRKLCGEGVCRLQCFNTRDDDDLTVGIGGERGERRFDLYRDRDWDRHRDRFRQPGIEFRFR
jgi:hypothetical protein